SAPCLVELRAEPGRLAGRGAAGGGNLAAIAARFGRMGGTGPVRTPGVRPRLRGPSPGRRGRDRQVAVEAAYRIRDARLFRLGSRRPRRGVPVVPPGRRTPSRVLCQLPVVAGDPRAGAQRPELAAVAGGEKVAEILGAFRPRISHGRVRPLPYPLSETR